MFLIEDYSETHDTEASVDVDEVSVQHEDDNQSHKGKKHRGQEKGE